MHLSITYLSFLSKQRPQRTPEHMAKIPIQNGVDEKGIRQIPKDFPAKGNSHRSSK
jgi:hypothetical protein